MYWERTFLVALFHALPLVSVVEAEGFFKNRDHKNQLDYVNTTNVNVVKNRGDAEFVLSKYGYLRCQVSRRKRDISDTRRRSHAHYRAMGIPMMQEGRRKTCDETEVQKAILIYQRTYRLPETGELDNLTKSLMSTSRCGNKDSDKDKAQEELKKKEETASKIPHKNRSQQQHSTRIWKRSASKTRLYKVLAGDKPRTRGLEYHKRFLEEYTQNLKKTGRGESYLLKKYTPKERRKRSVHVSLKDGHSISDTNRDSNGRFQGIIRWRLLTTGYSTRIPVEDQHATITLAFRMWSEVIPLMFVEDTSGDINSVDIEIAFGKESHQNCDHDFDGNGGEIAHSWNAGNMHFDDEENFKSIRALRSGGIYLLRVTVHEIGHVLGLSHTNQPHSIMYAIYRGTQLSPDFELNVADRHDIQKIYGVCKGQFNTIFDWVRRRPDNQFIYNTYFFRADHYWMYENHANRTRYGDPLYIAREWDGVPNKPDGYVHVWLFSGDVVLNDAYFFQGEHYYKYDSEKDRVMTGWPRRISEDFGPKPGSEIAVPSNINSVFYDTRDAHLYFFKNDDVYVYDPNPPSEAEKGCCVRISKITDEFPAEEGHTPLPGNLDAVYYSYRDKMMYFFKGTNLWRNKMFDPRQRRIHNKVEFMGPWYEKWRDICDVYANNGR